MSLINVSTGPADLATKQAKCKQSIQQTLNAQYKSIIFNFTRIFALVWDNNDLTPQQVMDALGTDAAQLFQIASAMQTAVNSIQPDSLPQSPPKSVTANDDGTVTIGS